MQVLASPRVGSEGLPVASPASSLVLSWQPLGSPVRRMKRAMRFVQQNTCVTQRVTVDIGSAARLVIPCFEGITTVSDLVETVRHRFPEYGITGLRQPLSRRASRPAWDAGGSAAREDQPLSVALDPSDFVSVAVGSDAALVAVGSDIPITDDEDDEDDEDVGAGVGADAGAGVGADAGAGAGAGAGVDAMFFDEDVGLAAQETTENASGVNGAVVVSAPVAGARPFVPKTPVEKRRLGSRPSLGGSANLTEVGAEPPVEEPPTLAYRHSFASTPSPPRSPSHSGVLSTPSPRSPKSSARRSGGIRSGGGGGAVDAKAGHTAEQEAAAAETAADATAAKTPGGSMATVVRERLMQRIQSLAAKGAISASQRGYLNTLIGSPTSSATEIEAPPTDAPANSETAVAGRRGRMHPHRTLLPQQQVEEQTTGGDGGDNDNVSAKRFVPARPTSGGGDATLMKSSASQEKRLQFISTRGRRLREVGGL